MSNYDLYKNTICKDDDNDYIILFKDDESAKTVFDEFNAKDQRIAELESEVKQLIMENKKLKSKVNDWEKRFNSAVVRF